MIPTSVAPITFFVREEADWMTPHRPPSTRIPASEPPEARGLSEVARQVLDFLRQRGASFFADIVRGTGRLKAEVETALWELVAGGLITADGFDNLRSLIDPKRRAGQGSGRTARPRHSTGRWALLYTDQAADRNRAVEATCWMLLKRYGIVFRDLLARETNLPKWRELQMAFRRLEDRGEIRGGRFVDGFLGEQFALPVAVESLRATRKMLKTGETIVLSAADPLNLVGILVPGERVPAISGKTVAFSDGVVLQTAVSRDAEPLAAIGDKNMRVRERRTRVRDEAVVIVSKKNMPGNPMRGSLGFPGRRYLAELLESASPVAFLPSPRHSPKSTCSAIQFDLPVGLMHFA